MKFISIAELGKVTSGGTPKTSVDDYWNGDIPWLTPGDLSNFNGTYFSGMTKRSITKAGLENSAAKLLPRNTLLLTIRAPIGYSALTAFPVATNQDYKAIVLHENIEPLYALYALRFATPQLLEQGRGATIEGINLDSFETVKIPLPSLDEQRRIARILDQADRLRRLRRHARQQTDTFLQSVFVEMFGDLIQNTKQWDKALLGEIADVQGGLQLSSKRKNLALIRPYLRVANVYRNRLNLAEIKHISLTQAEFERTKLQKGDILIVEGHGNPEEIGRCAIWDGSIENCVHQNHLIRVRTDQRNISNIFLSFFINSPEGRRYFTSESNTTSGLNTISTSVVKECSIPLPPIGLQNDFAAIQRKAMLIQKQYEEAERQAEMSFQALLHRAFTGQLTKQLTGEPA